MAEPRGTGRPDAAQRRHRREVLRRHHPDVGGDPETFVRLLRELDAGPPRGGIPFPAGRSFPDSPAHDLFPEEVRFVRRPRGLARIRAWYRTRLGRRHRIPRVR